MNNLTDAGLVKRINEARFEIRKWREIKNKASRVLIERYFKDVVIYNGKLNHTLTDGTDVVVLYKTTYEIDKSLFNYLHDDFIDAGINLNRLRNPHTGLVLSEYENLSNSQRELFDKCLIKTRKEPLLFIEE